MSDLISRQAAIEELSYCQTYLFDTRDHDEKISLEDAEYTIERLPSVDAVEVVRCKDCKWYDLRFIVCHNPRFGDGWANYQPPKVIEDFFCNDGERKNDG